MKKIIQSFIYALWLCSAVVPAYVAVTANAEAVPTDPLVIAFEKAIAASPGYTSLYLTAFLNIATSQAEKDALIAAAPPHTPPYSGKRTSIILNTALIQAIRSDKGAAAIYWDAIYSMIPKVPQQFRDQLIGVLAVTYKGLTGQNPPPPSPS